MLAAGRVYEPGITVVRLRRLYGDNCHYCGRAMYFGPKLKGVWEPTRATFDHQVPVSHGGDHVLANVTLACHECNLMKSATTAEVFKERLKRIESRVTTPIAAVASLLELAFEQRITDLGGRVVGRYFNKETPVEVVCAQGHVSFPHPGSVFGGQGICRKCAGAARAIPRKRDAEAKFRRLIEENSGRVLGAYVNAQTPVAVQHLECGRYSFPHPVSVIAGCGFCQSCAAKKSNAPVRGRNAERFRDLMERTHGSQVLGEYRDSHTKVDVIHSCGRRVSIRPYHAFAGHSPCRPCAISDAHKRRKLQAAMKGRAGECEAGPRSPAGPRSRVRGVTG